MSSSVRTDNYQACAGCGASIYPEHVDKGIARLVGGRLLCRHCLVEAATPAPVTPEIQLEPLQLIPEEEVSSGSTAVAAPAIPAPAPAPSARARSQPGRGATRVRTFHARLSEGAVHHLDELVNQWLEQNPEVEIKFAQTAVGVWEGKHAEPNLIITLFY